MQKILDFFKEISEDETAKQKLQSVSQKLGAVNSEETAKEFITAELVPLAKSKGYDITAGEFIEFLKNASTELTDDALAMASGGQGGFWNKIGQSLMIFGTGAGLFAGATFGALGGSSGNTAKQNNRPAYVQTVDNNRDMLKSTMQSNSDAGAGKAATGTQTQNKAQAKNNASTLQQRTSGKTTRSKSVDARNAGGYLQRSGNPFGKRVNAKALGETAKSEEAKKEATKKDETKKENKEAVNNVKKIINETKSEEKKADGKDKETKKDVKESLEMKEEKKEEKKDSVKKEVKKGEEKAENELPKLVAFNEEDNAKNLEAIKTYCSDLESVTKKSGFLFWSKTEAKDGIQVTAESMNKTIGDLEKCGGELEKIIKKKDANEANAGNAKKELKAVKERVTSAFNTVLEDFVNSEELKIDFSKNATLDNIKTALESIEKFMGKNINVLDNATDLASAVQNIKNKKSDIEKAKKEINGYLELNEKANDLLKEGNNDKKVSGFLDLVKDVKSKNYENSQQQFIKDSFAKGKGKNTKATEKDGLKRKLKTLYFNAKEAENNIAGNLMSSSGSINKLEELTKKLEKLDSYVNYVGVDKSKDATAELQKTIKGFLENVKKANECNSKVDKEIKDAKENAESFSAIKAKLQAHLNSLKTLNENDSLKTTITSKISEIDKIISELQKSQFSKVVGQNSEMLAKLSSTEESLITSEKDGKTTVDYEKVTELAGMLGKLEKALKLDKEAAKPQENQNDIATNNEQVNKDKETLEGYYKNLIELWKKASGYDENYGDKNLDTNATYIRNNLINSNKLVEGLVKGITGEEYLENKNNEFTKQVKNLNAEEKDGDYLAAVGYVAYGKDSLNEFSKAVQEQGGEGLKEAVKNFVDTENKKLEEANTVIKQAIIDAEKSAGTVDLGNLY